MTAAETVAYSTRRADFQARYRRQLRVLRRPSSLFALSLLAALCLLAVLAKSAAPESPSEIVLQHQFQHPSWSHLMGTDELGRDVFSRVIAGTRYSVISVVSVLSIALLVGTAVGAVAGYFGRFFDELLMRITDVFLSFPSLVLALAISVTLGAGLGSAILAVGAVWWPTYARLVRGQVMGTKTNDYVEAARALGVSRGRILVVHVLRNCMTPVLVQLTLDMGNVLVTFAGLSFLGLGAPPGSPEWGATINDGQGYILTSWWIATFPGLALYLAALALNLFGEMIGELLMPGRAGRLSSGSAGRWKMVRRRRTVGERERAPLSDEAPAQ